jgi:TetR/AcrR family transcriptional repressor of mexJK operon
MNQIAKDAGVTKLTVYNHFQDKEVYLPVPFGNLRECISNNTFV